MEPPKSCPHLEVRYEKLRQLKMGAKGLSADSSGWYCVWCKQKFAPVESEEADGPKPKSSV